MSFGQELKDFASGFGKGVDISSKLSENKYRDALTKKAEKDPAFDLPGAAKSDPSYDGSFDSSQPHGMLYNMGSWLGLNDGGKKKSPTAMIASPLDATQAASAVPLDSYSNAVDPGTDDSVNGYSAGGLVDEDPENPGQPVPTAAPAAPAPTAVPAVEAPTRPADDAGIPDEQVTSTPKTAGVGADEEGNPAGSNTPAPLSAALHGGITALQSEFGLKQQGVPDQEAMAGGRQRLMSSDGRASHEDMKSVAKAVDPNGELSHSQMMLRAMTKGYEFYMERGQPDKANNYAAMIIQYSTFEASKHGEDAIQAIQKGDIAGAAKSLAAGYSNIPDGKEATNVKVNPDKTVTVTETDVATGKPVNQHTLTGMQLYQAAIGLANKSESWKAIMAAAAAAKGVNLPPSDSYNSAVDRLNGVNADGTVTQPGNTPPANYQPQGAGGAAPAGGSKFNTKSADGMTKPGNIDPWNRPVLQNSDGSYSTTSSISIGTNDGEVLIPTVINGKRLSNADAIAYYKKTGENLGTFKTPEQADAYATSLHNAQAAKYSPKGVPLSQGAGASSDAYMKMMATGESQNNPNAKNGDSTGLYQIQSAAWRQITGHDPVVNGVDERLDPKKNTAVMEALTQTNAKQFQAAAGRAPSPMELAVMHQQGATGGMKLMLAAKQAPNTPAAQIVGDPSKLTRNGIPANATAAQAVQHIQQYYTSKAGTTDNAPGTPQLGQSLALRPALPEDQVDTPAVPTRPVAPDQIKVTSKDVEGMSGPERVAYTRQVAATNQARQKKFSEDMQLYNSAVTQAKAAGKAGKDKFSLPVKDRTDALTALKEARPDPKDAADPAGAAMASFQPTTQKAVDDVAYGLYAHNDTTPQRAYQAAITMMSPKSMSFTPYEIPNSDAVRIVFRSGDKMTMPKNVFDQLAAARGNEHFVSRTGAEAAANKSGENADLGRKAVKAGKATLNIADNAKRSVVDDNLGGGLNKPARLPNALAHPLDTAARIGHGVLSAVDAGIVNQR